MGTGRQGAGTAGHGDPAPFWRRVKLRDMTPSQWESLCDGCGRCCLNKLEDTESGQVCYTDVACSLLDPETCRCTRYDRRRELMPDCIVLTPEKAHRLSWLPSTCAYRIIGGGGDLPAWHPLVSGNPQSVHQAGVSVRGRVVSEADAVDLEDRIVTWPE